MCNYLLIYKNTWTKKCVLSELSLNLTFNSYINNEQVDVFWGYKNHFYPLFNWEVIKMLTVPEIENEHRPGAQLSGGDACVYLE